MASSSSAKNTLYSNMVRLYNQRYVACEKFAAALRASNGLNGKARTGITKIINSANINRSAVADAASTHIINSIAMHGQLNTTAEFYKSIGQQGVLLMVSGSMIEHIFDLTGIVRININAQWKCMVSTNGPRTMPLCDRAELLQDDLIDSTPLHSQSESIALMSILVDTAVADKKQSILDAAKLNMTVHINKSASEDSSTDEDSPTVDTSVDESPLSSVDAKSVAACALKQLIAAEDEQKDLNAALKLVAHDITRSGVKSPIKWGDISDEDDDAEQLA